MSYLRTSPALRHLLRVPAVSTLRSPTTQLLRAVRPTAAAAPAVLHSATQCRASSHSPMSASAQPPRKKVTINTLRSLYNAKTPITMVTAHDFPSGLACDLAGVDMVLVGDSLAMVALGMEVRRGPAPRAGDAC